MIASCVRSSRARASKSVPMAVEPTASRRGHMTGREIAIEFTELWDSFDVEEINTMLAKNVSVELLEFFASYAEQALGDLLPTDESGDELARRLPNLMIIGYIIRVLEERLVE
jgi:hypothetical protein